MAEETQTHPSKPSQPDPTGPGYAIGTSQVMNMSGFQQSQNAACSMFPIIYPPIFPGMVLQNPEEHEQGPGIYAIPCNPYMGPMSGYPPNTLIPLTYKIPTRESSGGVAGEGQGQGQVQEARQQHGPPRQVIVRRFQFAFQLDLGLIIKLAAIVFLLSQEGSNQKLILLVMFAMLVYLYQTGALAPLLRLIRRAGAPPPQQPPVRIENHPPVAPNNGNDPRPEENPVAENQDQNQARENQEQPEAPDENHAGPVGGNGINWWGIVKEIQVFIVGFVTSLLPGFQHQD
ncbi:uncharacterized protein [Typha angustifolia]|uniref:uncharacterized protein isoform X2 n=1 Tax=Typha angustifolia TaxID=59011 RepID=UPI003C2BE38D